MAATDSSSNSLSPRTSGLSGDGSHRNSSNLSSPTPWAHIVRPESEVIQASPSSPQPVNSDFSSSAVKPASSSLSSDDSALQTSGNDNGNVSSAKKPPPPPSPAWNKPANGTIEAGPVMGAVSWPALSESSRALPKSFVDTGKSVSTQQGPLIASSPDKQANTNANPNSTPNHALPVRQKSMKRGSGGGGGGGGPANAHAAFSHPPSTLEMPRNNSSNLGATALHSSPGDHTNKSQNWDGESRGGFSPRTHIASDHPHSHSHPHPRGFSFRRGNGGPHPIPRGDASFPNNYAGRREHDRATNHEWNPRRNFNGSRDAHLQQQQQQHQQQHGVFPRSFMRHRPPGAGPFIGPPPPPPPPPGRPFGNPIGFHDMSMTTPVYYVPALPHDPLGVVPFIPVTPPPIFFPAPDPQLRASLLKQIDYYFR